MAEVLRCPFQSQVIKKLRLLSWILSPYSPTLLPSSPLPFLFGSLALGEASFHLVSCPVEQPTEEELREASDQQAIRN